MLSYKILPLDLTGHLFEVSLTIPQPKSVQQRLSMPAWIPGSYMIRDFARNVIGIYAESNGQTVPIKMIDKQTWELGETHGEVIVSYQVYAWDLSVRTAYLDQFMGFFNNSSLCLAVEGQTEAPCQLILSTTGDCLHWQVATGMPRISGEPFAAGVFEAESYEALIDYPMLLGELTVEEFIAGGIKHSLVLAGRHYADTSRITSDLARICEQQLKLFGQPAPFSSYTFLTMVVGKGFGGLEHRNSTALLCSRKDLAHAGKAKIDSDYRTFLSLCSHEYFHSWNVKTLKPKRFLPYQLNQESYTEQLWFYEGITSYFDDYILHQAGLIDAETYLTLLGDTIARVYRGAGVTQQTVTESSFSAWTKFYKQDENSPNAIVSYYGKGALIALCIDLKLRLQSKHQLTLAQVMKDLWQQYGQELKGTDDDTVIEHLHSYPGIEMREFLHSALYTTENLPIAELLLAFGVVLKKQVPADDNSHNGKVAATALPVALGAKFKASPQGLELLTVYQEEAAHAAGLSAGDRVIAIDHLQVVESNFKEVFERFQEHDEAVVHAFRRDELLTLKLIWQAPKASSRVLTVSQPDELHGWLKVANQPTNKN